MIIIGMLNLVIHGAILVFILRSYQKSRFKGTIVFDRPLWFALFISVAIMLEGIILYGINGDFKIIYQYLTWAAFTIFLGLLLTRFSR